MLFNKKQKLFFDLFIWFIVLKKLFDNWVIWIDYKIIVWMSVWINYRICLCNWVVWINVWINVWISVWMSVWINVIKLF